VLDTAVLFQSHHKQHRDALVATIEKPGGKPVMAKSNADYAAGLGVRLSLRSPTAQARGQRRAVCWASFLSPTYEATGPPTDHGGRHFRLHAAQLPSLCR
jgi:hypothetical protein